MTPTNDEQAALLKAEAISARRRRRTAWQNAHVDRVAREREARETSKVYRQGQREAERAAVETKPCTSCKRTLPLDSFHLHKNGSRRPRCKSCRAAEDRKRYYSKPGRADTGKRAINPERQRKAAERLLKEAAERQRKAAERQRKAAERIAHLTSLLMGSNPGQHIASEEGWDVAVSELQSLWLQSGDKECVSCKAVVPPSAMLAPGPGNFYPGQCRPCVRLTRETNHRATFGPLIGPLPGPRKIPMRDGTSITVAEFARRCRERGITRQRDRTDHHAQVLP